MKRIVLFVLTNIAVLVLATLVAQAFGLERYLTARGIDPVGLLVFAALFGFGGAFVSLALSKWVARHTMGVRVIREPRNPTEAWLLDTVRSHAERVGIGMPEVGIFEADHMNAFATGARRDSALVAVSTALLAGMDRREAEAVIGHEISHIANGDMVTLALLQGVLNTFVIFLSRVVGFVVDSMLRGQNEQRGPGPAFLLTTIVAQIVFGLLASMIVMAFSRYREFRADAGGASLTGPSSMIAALERLRAEVQRRQPAGLPEPVKAFGISSGFRRGAARLFMSHPPLEERIARLRDSSIAGNLQASGLR